MIRPVMVTAAAVLLGSSVPHAEPDGAQVDYLPGWVGRFSLGCIGGVNLSDLHYSDKTSEAYSSSRFVRPTFGVYGELRFADRWALRPEIAHVGKGQKIVEADFRYTLAINSIDVRLPVLFDVLEANGASVYLQAGPYVGIPYGGTATYGDDAHFWETSVSDATVAPAEFGVLVGAGARNRFKTAGTEIRYGLDVAYDIGLTDNYSRKEHDRTSKALNASQYVIEGTRTDRGVLVRGMVGVPFGGIYKTFCADDCDPEAAFRAAMRLHKRRQYLDAAYAFGRVATKWPRFWKNDSATLYKGRSLEDLHLHAAARKAYETGLASYGNSPLAARFHFQLLNVAYKDADWSESQTNFDAATRLAQARPEDPVRTDAAYVMGEALFAQSRLSEARRLLETIPQGDPNHLYARYTLGLIDVREGRLEDARIAFESILGKAPASKSEKDLREGAETMLGHVLYSLPQPQLTRAVELYAQVPPGSGFYDEAQLGTAWCFVRNAGGTPRFWADADLHASNIPPRSILHPEGLLVRGYSRLSRGDCDSASKLFQTLLDAVARGGAPDDSARWYADEHAAAAALQPGVSESVYRLTLLQPSERVLADRRALQADVARIAKERDDFARFQDKLALRNKFLNTRERLEKDATYGLATAKNCLDRAPAGNGAF